VLLRPLQPLVVGPPLVAGLPPVPIAAVPLPPVQLAAGLQPVAEQQQFLLPVVAQDLRRC